MAAFLILTNVVPENTVAVRGMIPTMTDDMSARRVSPSCGPMPVDVVITIYV